MIAILGDKSFKGGSEKLIDFPCRKCGSINTTELSCYHTYYHCFFIPVYPYKQEFVAQCLNCGDIYNINPKENTAFQYLYKKYPNPVWMWIGLPIVTALVVLFFYSDVYLKFFKK